MTDLSPEHWERQLLETARDFSYPPTPDLTRGVRLRLESRVIEKPARSRQRTLGKPRLAWTLALVALALAILMAVPPVRAQILEYIQIGIIRIFQVEPTPTPTSTPTPSQSVAGPAGLTTAPPTPAATRQPSPTPITSLLDLAGETTLEAAQTQASFTLQLPAYPPDLGPPGRVFVQDLDGEVVVLVWLDPSNPDRVQLSLHMYSGESNMTGAKIQPVLIQETSVDGHPAIWAQGPYLLKLRNGGLEVVRLIEGRVLIWEMDGVTYRLESDLELGEALKIAESLQPFSRDN